MGLLYFTAWIMHQLMWLVPLYDVLIEPWISLVLPFWSNQQQRFFLQQTHFTMSKEWIQQRMALLRKQAGFAFHQDLAISILLCLMSGRDKHLVLTAAPHRLQEVAQMASMVSCVMLIVYYLSSELTSYACMIVVKVSVWIFNSQRSMSRTADTFRLDSFTIRCNTWRLHGCCCWTSTKLSSSLWGFITSIRFRTFHQ